MSSLITYSKGSKHVPDCSTVLPADNNAIMHKCPSPWANPLQHSPVTCHENYSFRWSLSACATHSCPVQGQNGNAVWPVPWQELQNAVTQSITSVCTSVQLHLCGLLDAQWVRFSEVFSTQQPPLGLTELLMVWGHAADRDRGSRELLRGGGISRPRYANPPSKQPCMAPRQAIHLHMVTSSAQMGAFSILEWEGVTLHSPVFIPYQLLQS